MASILLPCHLWFGTSATRGNLLKKHKLHNHCCAKASSSSWNFGRKNNTFSFNYRSSSAGVPLHELPGAPFDQYMEDVGRVIQAIFPEKSTNQQLNKEEWRVKMTPIKALFLTCQPIIYITARCLSEGEDYPPEIPGHIIKLIEVQTTRWELQGLHSDYIPLDFNINASGALYLERQGRHSWMKNQIDISLSLAFPPLLAWVPEHVMQKFVHSVLRNYVEDINNGFAVRLLADYNSFKRDKPKNSV
ncbi:uncharacterized protein LOC133284266 [Gastrolobium bilobum]|uniref:uncharacterized protein LOC133284266 n=1 Tax=Gastrolobium bilobum TaxID=150636 RepID=UPI002AB1B801|nr:uncharacterized protein LOC133284266 [Gastrolobium bilobum]